MGTWALHVGALLRRRIQTKLSSPIRSVLIFIVWPLIILLILTYLTIKLNQSKIPISGILDFMPFLFTSIVMAELMCVASQLLTDKSTKFRSLLFTMGCKRSAYFSASFIWLTITISLMFVIPTIIFVHSIIIFKEQFSTLKTIIKIYIQMLILIPMQYATLPLILTSFITTKNLNLLVQTILIADIFVGRIIIQIVTGNRPNLQALKVANIISCISPNQNLYRFITYFKGQSDEVIGKMQMIDICIIMTVISIFSLILLAYIIDLLVPWQPDIPSQAHKVLHPITQLFTNNNTNKNRSQIKDEFEENSNNIQLVNDNNNGEVHNNSKKYFRTNKEKMNIGIKLVNLTKEYKNKTVVDNINFNIFKGEVTLLLGHNGAGKTTLMNMILGNLNPTIGNVSMYFERAKNLGYCPQDSYLDDSLNAVQHLQLVCQIKSQKLTQQTIDNINKTLDDVGLSLDKLKLPQQMSGGMKRKLSLAMALVGNSNVLILDEPSSGLDPDSRRVVWDCIKAYKDNRAVLLSTQHMEEADFLGDQVAIMADGRIICSGSATYLVNSLGSGYKLRVESASTSIEQILLLARQYFKSALFEDEVKMQMTLKSNQSLTTADYVILLNDDDEDDNNKSLEKSEKLLIEFVKQLEAKSQVLAISSFSLKSSSIEDVMLNTGKLHSNRSTTSTNSIFNISREESVEFALKTFMNSNTCCKSSIISAFNIKHYLCLVGKELREFIRNYVQALMFTFLFPLFGYILFKPILKYYCYLRASNQTKSSELTIFFPYICFTIQFLAPPIKEKETQLKAIMHSSKLSIFTYWLSKITVDLFKFIPSLIMITYALKSINDEIQSAMIQYFTLTISKEAYLVFVSGTLLFGLASMIQFYFLATQCSNSNKVSFAVFFAYILQNIISTLLKLVKDRYLYFVEIWNWLNIVTLPIHSYGFFINQLISSNLITYKYNNGRTIDESNNRGYLYLSYIILLLQVVVYLLLLYRGEVSRNNWFKYLTLDYYLLQNNKKVLVNNNQIINVDDNVCKIEEQTNNIMAEKNKSKGVSAQLVACKLSKQYARNVPVVNQLSFYVQEQECFGLLGVNGAGKSTTINMLVGETRQDSGQLLACNQTLPHWCDARYFKSNIGFDPQSSPEVYLTPREAFRLMAQLRCEKFSNKRIEQSIDALLVLLDMEEHQNKQVAALSGGNKRKLALGMSLIESPRLLVLDEPTAGVDPLGRRSIWKLLLSLRSENKASIVISSHAMEECEAICDKISIMARGKLRCIGSFQQLRSKFCKGTIIKVQILNKKDTDSHLIESNEQILNKFMNHLHQSLQTNLIKLEDKNQNGLTLNVFDESVAKSKLLLACYEFKMQYLHIFQYTVNDTSLEDIFIKLANENLNTTNTPIN